MKIENIIEDIKKDVHELSRKLEEQWRNENPDLIFSISLPGLEELTTIKSIAISIQTGNTTYCLSVHIHTHNGNRVFENEAKEIINNQPVPFSARHPLQDRFVELLRDIIKKRKQKMKSGNKSGNLHDEINAMYW